MPCSKPFFLFCLGNHFATTEGAGKSHGDYAAPKNVNSITEWGDKAVPAGKNGEGKLMPAKRTTKETEYEGISMTGYNA